MQRFELPEIIDILRCDLEDTIIRSYGIAHIAPCYPGVAAGAVLSGSPASLQFFKKFLQ